MEVFRLFVEAGRHWMAYLKSLSPTLPYIFNVVVIGIVPTVLAGIGGHLATLALPGNSTTRRRWKLLVWGLVVGGIFLYGWTQVLAYRVDQEKEKSDTDFKGEVLKNLHEIADETSKKKRLEAVEKITALIDGNIPLPFTNGKPKPASGIPQTPTASTSEAVAPDGTPTTTAVQSGPPSCPTAGKLAMLWRIEGNKMPRYTYDFYPSVKESLHPILQGLINIEAPPKWLTSAQSSDYLALEKDIRPRLPKLTPIQIDNGSVSPEQVINGATHDFRSGEYIAYEYLPFLPNGQQAGSRSSGQILISNLSKEGRAAVADLDESTKSWVDGLCTTAMENLKAMKR